MSARRSRRSRRGSGRRRQGEQSERKPSSVPSQPRAQELNPDAVRKQVDAMIQSFPPEPKKIPEFMKKLQRLRSESEKKSMETVAPGEFFYLTASCVETQAEEELDRVFDSKYRGRLAEVRGRHELGEHEFWAPDDPNVPEDYREILESFRAEKRKILAHFFRERGNEEAAELVENDYAAYLQRKAEGKQLIFERASKQDDDWLTLTQSGLVSERIPGGDSPPGVEGPSAN